VSAVGFLLRAHFRQQWRGWVGVALLGGVIGGAVIATLAGARRTETSYQRFVEATHAFDVALTNGGGSPGSINRQFKFDEIARLPEVADAALSYHYEPSGTTASGRAIETSELSPLASVDGKLGTSLNKARVLHGRLPRGDGELAITPVVADVLGVRVGEVLHLQLRSPQVPRRRGLRRRSRMTFASSARSRCRPDSRP
jgi:hypothetical protein